MKIGIIVGSVREGRRGASAGAWVQAQAQGRAGFDYEIVDLKSFDVPVYTASVLPMAAKKKYDDPRVQAWSDAVDAHDAYIFVTPEYNHGVPAALKNAVDVLYPEWRNKGVALVSYGADAGVRAVEQWRQILANVFLHVTRGQLSIRTFEEFEDGRFVPNERRPEQMAGLFGQLESLSEAVKVLRQP